MSFPYHPDQYMAMLQQQLAQQHIAQQQMINPYVMNFMPQQFASRFTQAPQTMNQNQPFYPCFIPQQMQFPFMMLPQQPVVHPKPQNPQVQVSQQPPTPQVNTPVEASKPAPPIDKSKAVHVNGTKIWLNLRILRESGDVLDYDEEKKRALTVICRAIERNPRKVHMRRMISTRRVKAEDPPAPVFFMRNYGYIRIGKGYQAKERKIPLNLSSMRRKLKFFYVSTRNSEDYDLIKDMLKLSDIETIFVLEAFQNKKQLIKLIEKHDPSTMEKIDEILKLKQ